MADVNMDRLRELAGYLRDACRQLRELGKLGETEFLADAKAVNSAKYLLIVATEAALDICGHVVAKRGGRSPEDYADCMRILGELGVLEEDLKIRMGKMDRFRNLLVHLYWKVEDWEVYRIMRERLGDFDEYVGAVGRFVESSL